MRVNVETRGIRKARRLAKLLSITHREAIGGLVLLWENSQDLECINASCVDIEFWFDPDGDFEKGSVLASLIETGFITELDGLYFIHGNEKHVDYLKSRRKSGSIGGKKKAENVAHAKHMLKQTSSISLPNAMQSNAIHKEKPSVAPPLGEIWNKLAAAPLPRVKKVTGTRLKQVKARWAEENSRAYWEDIVKKISQSDFCLGKNKTGWRASFDFLLKPDTHIKVQEGVYDNARAVEARQPREI